MDQETINQAQKIVKQYFDNDFTDAGYNVMMFDLAKLNPSLDEMWEAIQGDIVETFYDDMVNLQISWESEKC